MNVAVIHLKPMLAQFIPLVWPILLPALVITGIPISVFAYHLFLKFTPNNPSFKLKTNLALTSILSTIVFFLLVNFLFWRYIENTTPDANALYVAADRGATSSELIAIFGEPDSRERSNLGNDTFVYTALIKYHSGDWGIGTVGVELNSSGIAIDTWTAD